MRKFIPSIVVIALVAIGIIAGQLSYSTAQVDTVIGAGLATNGTHSVASIVFTNGWAWVCTPTSIVLTAP